MGWGTCSSSIIRRDPGLKPGGQLDCEELSGWRDLKA